MTDPAPTALLSLAAPLHASAAMRAIVADRARLQRMLDFEAALARAAAAVGMIPAGSVGAIADACNAERYDIAALAEASARSGSVAVAMVEAVGAEIAKSSKEAAGFVHFGASDQDVVDTALVLELRAAIDALLADLETAVKGFAALAGRHRRTLGVARMMMQPAQPMPLGLKFAGYAAALARSRERLTRLRREALALQFGGAAGTLAPFGEQGMAVSERLAALLDLPLPDAPWHTHRDRLTEIASAFAIITGTCGKIARDVALMMQIEVGEALQADRAGHNVSLAMPGRRNPALAAAALSAATAAPNLVATLLSAQVQEHEASLGAWLTEWTTFPALALVTSGALASVVQIAEGLEVDVDRLRANLDVTGGQIMAEALSFALAEKIGRAEATALMRELNDKAAAARRPLKEVMLGNLRAKSLLTPLELEKLFIPLTYLGSSQMFIDRLVISTQMRGHRRPESRPHEPRSAEMKPQTQPQFAPSPSTAPVNVVPQAPTITMSLKDMLSRVDAAATVAAAADKPKHDS